MYNVSEGKFENICNQQHVIILQQLQDTFFNGSALACYLKTTVPDTSYLRGSKVFHSFPAQVSVKVREDICSATAPLPHTTRTGIHMYIHT